MVIEYIGCLVMIRNQRFDIYNNNYIDIESKKYILNYLLPIRKRK